MYPVLYLETAFTDTGILETYRDESGDTTTRTVSIGHSWTMKVCSGVRVYGESNHLAFFLYEKQLAMKYFAAHSRARSVSVLLLISSLVIRKAPLDIGRSSRIP